MSRIPYLDQNTAPEKSRPLLNGLQQKLGTVPNLFKALANSPAALASYTSLTEALASSSLSSKIKESLAIATAQYNSCEYCLSAHSFIGGKLGLTADDIQAARDFNSSDTKTNAALKFAQSLMKNAGNVPDAEFSAAQAAGLTEGEMAEICAITALNIFTNYFNIMAKTDVDFPKMSLSKKAA